MGNLRSLDVADRELLSKAIHDTSQNVNNRTLPSHQRLECGNAVCVVLVASAGATISRCACRCIQFFNLGRLLIAARHYRELRQRTVASWARVVDVYDDIMHGIVRPSQR
jgi:hypothetical protein